MVLDFYGVAKIDQAFADEVFRVFATAHPGVALAPINMSAARWLARRMLPRAPGAMVRESFSIRRLRTMHKCATA